MIQIVSPVRVRFAPSPTGFLHIGGVRTALFNWLFARHYGGQFILRIEDTDEKRYVPAAAAQMMESLRWCGIDWDEGPDIGGPHAPYIQSERSALGIYQEHVTTLLQHGLAYKSFITPEELEQRRAAAQASGLRNFRYRGPEREWTLEQMEAEAATGKPYTVRLKVPMSGTTTFHDLVRGGEAITIDNSELYDIVLLKSSGMPVYHLAHLVDDHLMEITHVIRGEEWVPSTPYHILLYQAFGWEPPIYAHVPNILRQEGGGKLSKRKDDVATNRFWERGYLPEAMMNYLALQGWSYDDHTEIMSRDELIARYTIDRVVASPARWNPDKLLDMNGIYMRSLDPADLAQRALPFLSSAGLISTPPTATEQQRITDLMPLIQERLKELHEVPDLLSFFLHDIDPPDEATLIQKKMDHASTLTVLQHATTVLADVQQWEPTTLEAMLRPVAEELQLKPGQVFGTVRAAVTGRKVSPPIFDTLVAIGREASMQRLHRAAAALAATSA